MIRLFIIASFGLFTVFAAGCSSTGDNNPPMMGAGDATTLPTPAPAAACSNHEESCPCDMPGEQTDCGSVKRVAGDYVWCSTGTQTCDQYGSWGKCTGAAVSTVPTR